MDVSIREIKLRIVEKQNHNSIIVGYTSGVFDLLHQGHRNYLESCKTLCDILVVGVDKDDLVAKNKGSDRPYKTVSTRIRDILSTGFVDEVFQKGSSSESVLAFLPINRYFIPSNRNLSSSRLELLKRLSIEVCAISYTEGISTTSISRRATNPPEDMGDHP